MNKYTDAILYIDNLPSLLQWFAQNHPDNLARDETGNFKQPLTIIGFARTPTVITGNTALSYVRMTDSQVAQWEASPNITVLARAPYTGHSTSNTVYDALFANTSATALYDAVYDRTPKQVSDGNGGTITVTPPNKFGVMG